MPPEVIVSKHLIQDDAKSPNATRTNLRANQALAKVKHQICFCQKFLHLAQVEFGTALAISTKFMLRSGTGARVQVR